MSKHIMFPCENNKFYTEIHTSKPIYMNYEVKILVN